MILSQTYDFFKTLNADSLCFGYQGSFNDEITNRVIDLSEININSIAELSKLKKKVSFLMAECFQNIVRHGDMHIGKIENITSTGLFLTRNIGKTFIISSANIIENNDIDVLQEKLKQINSLDKESLRELYLEILKKEGLSSKGGAGLGLVEMARKSNQKLEYAFDQIDKDHSYFYLQIRLTKENEADQTAASIIPISSSMDFHKNMTKDDILMIHKGNYSQDSIMPILKMIEDNMDKQSEVVNKKKRVYHLLVEILQNIIHHSYELEGTRPGIFQIGKVDRGYVINAGNYIENKLIKEFYKQLTHLQELDKSDLRDLYLSTLSQDKRDHSTPVSLGLINIARDSSTGIQFCFIPVDEKKSFFVISVSI